MKADPSRALEYHATLAKRKANVPGLKGMEERRLLEWNKQVVMPPSPTLSGLESEKERYADLLGSLKFQKR